LVKGWRWTDEIIFIAGGEMAVGVMARRVVMVDEVGDVMVDVWAGGARCVNERGNEKNMTKTKIC
jgi:hypothetical protein